MNRMLKGLVVIGALFNAAIAGAASTTPNYEDAAPFIGIDFYQPWMKGVSGWKDIYPSTYPGVSVYLGTKLHPNFGVELGYEDSGWQKRSWVLPAGSHFFGHSVPTSTTGITKIRRSGGHFDLVMSLPVVEALEVVGALGYGWVQPQIRTIFSASTNTSVALASVSGQGRGVFRVGLGMSYMATDMVGFRAKMGWEGTSTLRIKGNQAFQNAGFDGKVLKAFKGTTALSVGTFLKF